MREIIGVLLIIIGILLIISSAGGKFAVVGFVGPIPIGFGNDKRILELLLIVSAIILIAMILVGALHG